MPRPDHAEGCRCSRRCRLQMDDARYRAKRSGSATAAPARCAHLGPLTEQVITCGSCPGKPRLKVYQCDLHGHCTLGRSRPEAHGCGDCPDHTGRLALPLRAVAADPARTAIDTGLLARSPDRTWFNASLTRFRGQLLLAYRTGRAGSRLHIAALDERLRPAWSRPLVLTHPRASGGQEDPRLFVHREQLHISFIGVERVGGAAGAVRTSQLYARLDDALRAEAIVAPEYSRRKEWEKNWALFSHAGELHAVYSVRPHRILHLHDDGRTDLVSEQNWRPHWSGGLLRGGAAPMRAGDEYYHWFHGRKRIRGVLTYNAGLVVFEAKPPFRLLRYSPAPLLWPASQPLRGETKSVLFCCGALLENGRWRISCGVHDRSIEVIDLDFDLVEKGLVPCAPSSS